MIEGDRSVNSGESIELDDEEEEESAGLCDFISPFIKTLRLGLAAMECCHWRHPRCTIMLPPVR
jgi:hypothetical protein